MTLEPAKTPEEIKEQMKLIKEWNDWNKQMKEEIEELCIKHRDEFKKKYADKIAYLKEEIQCISEDIQKREREIKRLKRDLDELESILNFY